MPTLSTYLTETRDLLHDSNAQFYTTQSLTNYINKSRKRLAAQAQCIRVLITKAQFSTVQNQERYTFAALNTYVQATPGVQSILGVFSIAISQGTLAPVLDWVPWIQLQAYARSWQGTLTNYPRVWSQYGQGGNGSFYVWPIPSGAYSGDIDTYCLPVDLVDDTTDDAIPEIWTDAVSYYAAYLALRYAQRVNDSKEMLAEYERLVTEGRAFSEPPRQSSMYWTAYTDDEWG